MSVLSHYRTSGEEEWLMKGVNLGPGLLEFKCLSFTCRTFTGLSCSVLIFYLGTHGFSF